MHTTLKAIVLSLGLTAFGAAHAVSVMPLNNAQKKIAKAEIKKLLPQGSKIKSITFGFGPHRPMEIGDGLQHATVHLKSGRELQFTIFNAGGDQVTVEK
jgi:hypothetical protein